MGVQKTANVGHRARLWGCILGELRRHGRVEAERLARRIQSSAPEVDTACREMSALGWLRPGATDDGWVADGAATELLSHYPPLRSDIASPRVGRAGVGEGLAG
jgi:hypothetical protein